MGQSGGAAKVGRSVTKEAGVVPVEAGGVEPETAKSVETYCK